MTVDALSKKIQIAQGNCKAPLVLKNARIVNVYTQEIIPGDIAICDGVIVGIGEYEGEEEIDVQGKYAVPGLMDAHIHIESSFLSPEEFGKLCAAAGTTTVLADPHEIVNVCGMNGLNYMLMAAKKTALDIMYMMPSCVPCSELENNGATIRAEDIKRGLMKEKVLGVGEFMDISGVLSSVPDVLEKLCVAKDLGKVVDGHAPGMSGKHLAGYLASGAMTDHECATKEEVIEKLRHGMYVMFRYGTACKEMEKFLPVINEKNINRCMFCSDDRNIVSLTESGHMDEHIRVAIKNGLDPIWAIMMASRNIAECYNLDDRGAIAIGKRADIVLVNDLSHFKAESVYIEGKLVAKNGDYLPPTERHSLENLKYEMHVEPFSKEDLRVSLSGECVHVLTVHPGSVVTEDMIGFVEMDESGDFVYNPEEDIIRISVIERHQKTGNIANALLGGYGLKEGAIAMSVAHDSHNIVVVGIRVEDMEAAAKEVIAHNGGIALVKDGKVLLSIPLPIGGLMSDLPAKELAEQFLKAQQIAYEQFHVTRSLDSFMSIAFVSLPVIPTLRLTDMGLFNVTEGEFISLNV